MAKVTQVIRVVVDVLFNKKLLKILNILEVEVSEGHKHLVLEVAQHLSKNDMRNLVISELV